MIVLDTHAALWAAGAREKLSEAATAAIDEHDSDESVAISVITLVEIAWLLRRGRLAFSGTIEEFLQRFSRRFQVLPITLEIAALSAQLPPEYPSDPSDRLIGATALHHQVSLVTADRAIRESRALQTIW